MFSRHLSIRLTAIVNVRTNRSIAAAIHAANGAVRHGEAIVFVADVYHEISMSQLQSRLGCHSKTRTTFNIALVDSESR